MQWAPCRDRRKRNKVPWRASTCRLPPKENISAGAGADIRRAKSCRTWVRRPERDWDRECRWTWFWDLAAGDRIACSQFSASVRAAEQPSGQSLGMSPMHGQGIAQAHFEHGHPARIQRSTQGVFRIMLQWNIGRADRLGETCTIQMWQQRTGNMSISRLLLVADRSVGSIREYDHGQVELFSNRGQ